MASAFLRRLAGGAAAVLFSTCFPSAEVTASSLVERRELPGKVLLRYEWTDPNRDKIVAWRGDTRWIDPSVKSHRLTWTFEVAVRRLWEAIDAFGVPREWLSYRSTSAEDLRRQLDVKAREVQERGMTLSGPRRRRLQTDYAWVVKHGREDLRDASAGLLTLARQAGYLTQRDVIGLFASLVQSLDYRIPDLERQNSKGQFVYVGGLTVPIETLYNGWGDCDTRCVLFASLLANLEGTELVLVAGNNHSFVGFRAIPRPQDRYVDIKGICYVLVELTAAWPLGRISEKNWTRVRNNSFRIVRLSDGAGVR